MRRFLILVVASSATAALAEEYTFELLAGFSDETSDVSIPALDSTSSSTSEAFQVAGVWYFSGLSDDEGPFSRAEFLSRASSLRVAYERGEGSFTATSSSTGDLSATGSSDEFTISGRYVFQNSDWFGVGSLAYERAEAQATNFGSTEASTTFYSVGAGRYFGARTAASFVVSGVEDVDDLIYRADITHLGSIGPRWQYAVDAAVVLPDFDFDVATYELSGSLFPSNAIELGLGLNYSPRDSFDDVYEYEVFAGWFARRNLQFRASYGWVEGRTFATQGPTPLDTSDDNSTYNFGFNLRF